ncbi:biflaviolin synthase CYP158A2 [Kitasatospora xanthocidica]|uniref:cytochrome P450 n=1 Tax=Kitasatospora xanthocidica TaxID=83382 RepID=UPI001672FC8E|nr:cytochrome P450 [Kitasatospora xanthocidica]GHF35475.1 biflaviolin synthase CYP158A2 [Kitasatospora xanthocidica]
MTTVVPSATVNVTDIPHLDPVPAFLPLAEPGPNGVPLIELPSGHPAVHLTRYADVHKLLTDPASGRTETNVDGGPSFLPTVMPKELLLNLDAPHHARVRGFVAADYSANGVERLRPVLDRVVEEGIARLRAAESPDLFSDLIDRVPITVNCHFLGVPLEDVDHFRPSSRIVQIASHEDVPDLVEHFYRVYGYVQDLITGVRPVVPGGLIEQFRADRDRAEPALDDAELTGIFFGSLLGADQNIVSVLTKSLYTLLAAPALWRRLADEPEIAPRLAEELIRLIPLGTISAFPRIAGRDLETSVGLVPEGSVVYPDAFAANRDPEVFPDPLVIDPDRQSAKRHLQFGYGMHHCMGAALARMEIVTVLTRLAQEFPTLALAVEPADVPWDIGTVLRRPTSLPVTW